MKFVKPVIENTESKIGFVVGPIIFITILSMPFPETFLQSVEEIHNLTEIEVLEIATGMKTVLALLLLMII